MLTELAGAKDTNVRTPATLRLAMLTIRDGKRPDAERMIDALTTDEPKNARALTAQAELRNSGGKSQEALASVMAALQVDPRFARAHLIHGQVLMALGKTDEALKALSEAAQLDTVTGDPQLALARLHLSRGDSKTALTFARETATRQPGNPQARVTLARALIAGKELAAAQRAHAAQLQLGLLYEQDGDFTRAAERYRLVLKAQPNSPVALNTLAYGLAVRQKSPEEAKPLAQRAVALAPNDPTVADTLAWIEHLLGNHVEAARLIARAAKGVPRNAEVRLHAAFIYAATTNLSAARAEFDAAIKISPDLANRDDVRQLQARLSKQRDPVQPPVE